MQDLTEDIRYNDTDPIEVARGIFHLGVQDEKNTFNNVSYIIVDGDEVENLNDPKGLIMSLPTLFTTGAQVAGEIK